jgi:hypothetical protein
MTAWTAAQLDAIDGADELGLATRRADGTLRTPRIVWVVRHDDGLYVRSVNGIHAAWYRGVQTAHAGHITAGGVESDVHFTEADHAQGDGALDERLDAAYRRKYGRYPGPTASITAAAARETTLRIDPV